MEENMLSQLSKVGAAAVFAMLFAGAASAQAKSCQAVGGMLMTDLGAVDANTTMGVATGDLRGAVGATILSIDAQNNGATLIFTVQHHWVTETGDLLYFDQAKATVEQVGGPQSTRFGVVTYTSHLKGGTGRFAGATGDLSNIGEADLATGQLVFRYTGTVCFAQKN
jgi:hypothetical protein